MRSVVDERGRNGCFLILGSASPELLRQSSESLAGRIRYLELTPFLFPEVGSAAYMRAIRKQWLRGGYPRSWLAPSAEEAMRYLLDYPWPGNVRELANSVTAMCACCTPKHKPPIPASLLPVAILEHFRRPGSTPELTLTLPSTGVDLKALLFQIEKHFYGQALRRVEGSKEKAAALLGLNAPAFRKALRERFPDLVGERLEA